MLKGPLPAPLFADNICTEYAEVSSKPLIVVLVTLPSTVIDIRLLCFSAFQCTLEILQLLLLYPLHHIPLNSVVVMYVVPLLLLTVQLKIPV